MLKEIKNGRFLKQLLLLSCFTLLISAPYKASAIDIATAPTEAILQPQPPNFMIALDDSGSMAWETLAVDGDQGQMLYNSNTLNAVQTSGSKSSIAPYWRTRWAGPRSSSSSGILTPGSTVAQKNSNYNGMYYSPFNRYVPWKEFAATTGISSLLPAANVPPSETYLRHDSTTGYVLTDLFATLLTVNLSRAHYFVWSEDDDSPYLVNFEGSGRVYYKVDDKDKDCKIEAGELSGPVSLPSDITDDPDWIDDDSEDLQNFANWFTYYRTRWNTAIGASLRMIDLFKNVYIGVYSINGKVRNAVVKHRVLNTSDMKVYSDIKTIGDKLKNTIQSNSGTNLRGTLFNVGKYYKSGLGTGWASPLVGACQQNFAMVFTDGYWNGSFSSLPSTDTNADGPHGGTSSTSKYGGEGSTPYTDNNSNTLADVAMYYYKVDLDGNTSNNYVPPNGADKNPQQHMVTYTVGLGLEGETRNPYYDWPVPVENTLTTINDLHHAAVNGRGLYLSARNPAELDSAFSRIVSDVQSRSGSAASLSMNGEQISANLNFFQSQYSSDYWSGNVIATKLDSNGDPTLPGWKYNGLATTAADMLNNLDEIPDVLPGYTVDTDTVYNIRKIVTYNGSSGVPFRSNAALTLAQKKLLVSSGTDAELNNTASPFQELTDIINYLRGDHRKEIRYGGIYRNRGKTNVYKDEATGVTQSILYNYKLGDIVHSIPVYHDGVLYVGANDGMLHVVNATDGKEIFAYIPNLVFNKLKLLSEELYDNVHQFYVDLSPFAKKMTSGKTLLVGGLGGGGKGVYCLDITSAHGTINSESDAAAFVKWEFPSSTDPDMGFSFSKPYIVNTKAGWKVIFGNGYNSTNGKAVLYILSLDGDGNITGQNKIDTLSGGYTNLNPGTGAGQDSDTNDLGESNGLSTPNIVDVDGDGYFDYVYAGDLFGNMWKFNIKDANVNNWKSAYGTAASPKPLFRAKNGSSSASNGLNSQPITSRPDVMLHCQPGYSGYIVVFGTGAYLGSSDITNKAVQAIYGLWDYGKDSDSNSYIGEFNSNAGTFISKSSALPSTISMVQQELVSYTLQSDIGGNQAVDVDARVLTNKKPEWSPAGANLYPSKDVGWYFPLKYDEDGLLTAVGERIINDIMIRDGAAIITSMIPDVSNMCSVGGSSWFYEINACTGGRLDSAHIDSNSDNKINKYDLVEIADPLNPGGPKIKVSVASVHYDSLIYPPVIARQSDSSSESKFMSTSAGTIVKIVEKAEKRGVFYWRAYDQ